MTFPFIFLLSFCWELFYKKLNWWLDVDVVSTESFVCKCWKWFVLKNICLWYLFIFVCRKARCWSRNRSLEVWLRRQVIGLEENAHASNFLCVCAAVWVCVCVCVCVCVWGILSHIYWYRQKPFFCVKWWNSSQHTEIHLKHLYSFWYLIPQ